LSLLKRATARSQIPVTNLKERIAALEQKTSGNGVPSSRPTSPNTNGSPVPGSSNGAPSATGFRDKIAKFERKGGVPVPRGRFGLGAPPTSEGPRKQGELYGNRIPAPARAVSASVLPVSTSRAVSPTSSLGISTPTAQSPGDRRSFSLSSVISDLDDGVDYTPISSPTFAFPPESPDSTLSVSFTPEASPTLSTNEDVPTSKRTMIRGTPFQKALEIARITENAKQGLHQVQQQYAEEATTPIARHQPLDKEEEPVGATIATPPAILLSSEDPVPVVVLHDSPTIESISPSDLNRSQVAEPVGTTKSSPPAIVLSSEEPVAAVVLHDSPTIESISPTDSNQGLIDTPTPTPPVAPSSKASSVHRSGSVEVKAETSGRKEPSITELPTVETVPLVIRKKIPTEKVAEPHEPVLRTPSPSKVVDEKVEDVPVSIPKLRKLPEPRVIISAPLPVQASKSLHPLPAPPKVVIVEEKVIKAAAPNLILPEIVEPAPEPSKQHDTPKIRPLPNLPPPSIVVHDDQTSTNDLKGKSSEISSRKAGLTLDQELLNDDSLISPPAVSGSMSAMSLTDVVTNYFTGGANGQQSFRTTTPPPLSVASPLSPMATLAYDTHDTSPRPAKLNPPDPQALLSPPPASGSLSAAPSSGGSSMGSVSSLGSRPMSMIEMSPSRVTRAMRMTPATSVGVPVFLPASTSGPRKSDFVYFPPTPEAEEEGFPSASLHKPSRSLTDIAEVSGNQSATFTAVVHRKVKETPTSATTTTYYQAPKRVPETPQMSKVQRITPLSPGQGELAALLQGALWLEDSLDRGELPSEAPVEDVAEKLKAEARKAAEEAEAKAQEEERRKIAIAKAQLQAKRDEPTSGRLKHTFLIPLTKARSVQHRKEASNAEIRPKSAGLPDKSGARNAKAEFAAAGSATEQTLPRPATPENKSALKPTESPPKSSKTSRFASFRRLGSISRPSTVHGDPTRHSESTSSEDSAPVVTPPVNSPEFRTKKASSPVSEFGRISESGSTTSFPSISPKKSIRSLGRASSFAERVWSRARTKSSGSTLSAASENTAGMHYF